MKRFIIYALVVLGLGLRGAGLPLAGTGDVRVWKVWAYVAATHGLTGAYLLRSRDDWPALTLNSVAQVRSGRIAPRENVYDGVRAPTDYPPGTIVALWIVGKLYQVAVAPDFANSTIFTVLVKLPIVLADAATAALIGWVVRRRAASGGAAWAWAAALACWCNPALILAGPVLGYFDALYSLPLLAALVALGAERMGVGGAAWGAALMIKLQALFMGPALALLALRQGRAHLAGYGLAALAAVGAVCAPFLLRGSFVGVLAGLMNNTQEDYLAANQVNLWWLWSYFWEWRAEGKGPGVLVRIVPISLIKDLGVADLNAWSVGLFAAFLLGTAAYWGRRTWGRRAAPGVIDLFLVPLHLWGATLLLPSIHENHLLAALPLLALLTGLAATGPGRRPVRPLGGLYGALSGVVGLNLLLFYGLGKGAPAPLPRMWFGFDASVGLAAVNVVLFAAALAAWSVYLRVGSRP